MLRASSNLPGWRARHHPAELSPEGELSAMPSLFGLAPGGVCRAVAVAGNAVRSYRTFSPLPCLLAEARRFVLCGTFPEVAFAGRYPAPHVDGARTFLPCDLSILQERPSGRLTLTTWRFAGAASSRTNAVAIQLAGRLRGRESQVRRLWRRPVRFRAGSAVLSVSTGPRCRRRARGGNAAGMPPLRPS